MSSANADFITEMLDAFWAWLAADADYTALGLKEFRLTDGKALPIKEDGAISGQDLPAIYVEAIRPTIAERVRTPKSDIIEIAMTIGIAYGQGAMHKDNDAIDCAAALMTVIDVIGSDEAHSSRLGNNRAINDFDWDIGEVEGVLADGGRQVLWWNAGIVVRLRRRRDPKPA